MTLKDKDQVPFWSWHSSSSDFVYLDSSERVPQAGEREWGLWRHQVAIWGAPNTVLVQRHPSSLLVFWGQGPLWGKQHQRVQGRACKPSDQPRKSWPLLSLSFFLSQSFFAFTHISLFYVSREQHIFGGASRRHPQDLKISLDRSASWLLTCPEVRKCQGSDCCSESRTAPEADENKFKY